MFCSFYYFILLGKNKQKKNPKDFLEEIFGRRDTVDVCTSRQQLRWGHLTQEAAGFVGTSPLTLITSPMQGARGAPPASSGAALAYFQGVPLRKLDGHGSIHIHHARYCHVL